MSPQPVPSHEMSSCDGRGGSLFLHVQSCVEQCMKLVMPNYLPLGQVILLTACPAQNIPTQFYGCNITNQKSVQNTIYYQSNILFQMVFGCCSPTFLDLGLVLEFEVAKFGYQWGRQR